jgi:hypothetical protein
LRSFLVLGSLDSAAFSTTINPKSQVIICLNKNGICAFLILSLGINLINKKSVTTQDETKIVFSTLFANLKSLFFGDIVTRLKILYAKVIFVTIEF